MQRDLIVSGNEGRSERQPKSDHEPGSEPIDTGMVANGWSEGRTPAWLQHESDRRGLPVRIRRAGFVQRLDLGQMAKLAEEHDWRLRVQVWPGDFVVEGDTVCDLWLPESTVEQPRLQEGPDAAHLMHLLDCFGIGHQRSPDQDYLFLVNQLVEVIARALSPGINDPMTAITCLEWLKGALIEFIECDERCAQPQHSDRVYVHPIGFERLLVSVFDQTRQYVCADRNVALHALTVLTEIGVQTARSDYHEALRRRMQELRSASRAALHADIGADDVATRCGETIRLLDDLTARERHRVGQGWFGGSV